MMSLFLRFYLLRRKVAAVPPEYPTGAVLEDGKLVVDDGKVVVDD